MDTGTLITIIVVAAFVVPFVALFLSGKRRDRLG